MDQLTRDWTDDELVNEIRRRERRAGTGGGRRAGTPRAGRARDLATIPTGELVRAAKGQQRAIYGSDNRQDIYKVSSPAVRKAADAVVALVKLSDLNENADGSFDLMTERYRRGI